MAPDELNAPLGQQKPKRLPQLPIPGPQLLAGLLGLSVLVVIGWAVLVNDPLGGEPIAVVETKLGSSPAKDGRVENGAKPTERTTTDAKDTSAAAKIVALAPPGSKTITIIDGSSGARQQVTVPDNSPKALLDTKLLEATRHGAIPKIGPDGARPSTQYAQSRQLPANKSNLPLVAIVIGGLGISASGTADAYTKLPPAVTFALAPYGADLENLSERARAGKHEVLLQVPMEPFDYPDNDPGPQTLLTSLTSEQNIDRLHWLMSRFQGYVGLIGFMGARFTVSEQSLGPVLRETGKRGLIYVDDGSSSRSIAAQLAGTYNLPFARADVVLDSVPTAAEIDHALARLEMKARDTGKAVGYATAQPSTIARIAEWTKKSESRGFILVPITTLAMKAKSS
ncbi:MAG TPA: divergent polysaccharide deacetylase family protein [Pseudolabrys sp.]|nr:divergent polysaccharide deacetylase family protein [Pseudolabrys sp.]